MASDCDHCNSDAHNTSFTLNIIFKVQKNINKNGSSWSLRSCTVTLAKYWHDWDLRPITNSSISFSTFSKKILEVLGIIHTMSFIIKSLIYFFKIWRAYKEYPKLLNRQKVMNEYNIIKSNICVTFYTFLS